MLHMLPLFLAALTAGSFIAPESFPWLAELVKPDLIGELQAIADADDPSIFSYSLRIGRDWQGRAMLRRRGLR